MADPGKTGSSSVTAGGSAEAEAKAQIRRTADKARHEATRMVDEAKARGENLLTEQQQSAAGQLDGVAKALRQAAEELNRQNQPRLAEYTEWSAGCVESCARQLRERDMGEMLDQMQGFARRQPGLFLGGAVIAGLLAARFLRSSGEHQHGYASSASPDRYSRTPFPQDPLTDGPNINDPMITPGGDLHAR